MPMVFASGATVDGGRVVNAPIPGSPAPSAPAPDESGDLTTSASPEGTTGLQIPGSSEDGEEPELLGEEGLVETELAEPTTQRSRRRFVSNLLRENERFKVEAERLRQQNDVLIQRMSQTQSAPQEPQPPAPQPQLAQPVRREDFQTEEAYLDARVQQSVEMALARRDAQATAQTQEQRWVERMAHGKQQFPDFDLVTTNPAAAPSRTLTPILYETVCESEHGHALLYHLGQHLDTLARLNALPPLAAARELGRLEASLASAPPVGPPPRGRPPAPTSAPVPPAPLRPVGGGQAPAPIGGLQPGITTVREYEAMRFPNGRPRR